MRPWLEGNLDGLDVRGRLDELREAVVAAAEAGEDLQRFWTALGAQDPLACAELAAGPRAVASAAMVRSALTVAESLESVITPSGLYHRLIELAPEAVGEVLAAAAVRHGGSDWLPDLCLRHEEVPGATLLRLALEAGTLAEACDRAAETGLFPGLRRLAIERGRPEPIVSFYRIDRLDDCLDLAAETLDAHPGAPVLQWLATVHGFELQGLITAIYARLTIEAARERLGRLASRVDVAVGVSK